MLLGWHTASKLTWNDVDGRGELCLYNAKVGIEFEFSRIIRVAGKQCVWMPYEMSVV